MKKFKNLLLTAIMAAVALLASCDPVNQDTLPDLFDGQNLQLSFSFFDSTHRVSGQDMGFTGDQSSNELYLAYRKANGVASQDNPSTLRLVKYDISSGNRQEFETEARAGFARRLHIMNNELKLVSGTAISTFPKEFGPARSIVTHGQSMTRFGTAIRNNDLYTIGGDLQTSDPDGILSNKIRKWNPTSSKFEVIATMPGPKTWASAEIVNNKMYIFGGQEQWLDTAPQKSVYIYDLSSGSFETTELPEAVRWTYTTQYQEKIIVAGQILREAADPADNDLDIFFQVFDPVTKLFHEVDINLSDDHVFTVWDMAIVGNELFVVHGNPWLHNSQFTIQRATIEF